MQRFLTNLNLTLVAALLACALVTWVSGLRDAMWYRGETVDLTFQLNRCELRHRALLTNIRREGLWKRLGLDSQPWLVP